MIYRKVAIRYFLTRYGSRREAAWSLFDDGFEEVMPDMSSELLEVMGKKPAPRRIEKTKNLYGNPYHIPDEKLFPKS